MSDIIKIKKGLDIRMKGEAEKVFGNADLPRRFAVKPPDFPNLMPKIVAHENDRVKAGSPLFIDKYRPDIRFVSPVSGTVEQILRGERRRILEYVVKADEKDEYEAFGKADPSDMSRDQIIEKLLHTGLWPFIRQRPYGIIANPEDKPKAIFISGFETAPLAPDVDFTVTGEENTFQTGLNALAKLTEGTVHLNLDAKYPPSKVFTAAEKVHINWFKGPHPAGNIGVQIHHVDPIRKGDIVWYIYPQDVIAIGRMYEQGVFDASRVIALTGSEVLKTRYFRTRIGASIEPLISENVKKGNHRYISGNVLTGSKVLYDGYIGFYDSQVTVIPEGDHYELFGWAMPGFDKFSISRSFFSWLQPWRKYKIDTNLHGGKRAYVMTGQYEKVLPMDIYPVQLIKAIMIEDIDLMENLGIYEVTEEDLALCEFVCTSKTEVQSWIRKGIQTMIKEMT